MGLHIPAEFVDKYNKPGPRYTSYPTVPAWDQPFGEPEYRQALQELGGRKSDELAIYLHLPFCAKHCHYCGCNALVTRETDAVDKYLDRVEKEIGMVTDLIGTGRRVVQIHWGGGTPNYLKNPQVERALNLFRSAFDLAPEAEVSLEIDPRALPRLDSGAGRERGGARDAVIKRQAGEVPMQDAFALELACLG